MYRGLKLWLTQPKFCILCSAATGEREPRPQSHFTVLSVLYARKTHLVAAFWFFGQHCNEWRNELPIQAQVESSICWQLTPYKHHSCSNWQINFCRVQNCAPPPKFCGPVRPNTSNMPKAGPGSWLSSFYRWYSWNGFWNLKRFFLRYVELADSVFPSFSKCIYRITL